MKTINYIFVILATILFAACSGSETYRGNWKATNAEGTHFEIIFSEKNFNVVNEEGDTIGFSYSQNSISIENSVETYGIRLDDGRAYQITFPIADDESVGFMADANGKLLYTISRTDYTRYEDIYKLN